MVDALETEGLAEESLTELYDHAPCGYLTTRTDGVILRINETLLGWIGRRRDDLIGKVRFRDLLTVPGRIYHDTHYDTLLHLQGSAHEIAFDMSVAQGGSLSVFVTSALKRTSDGAPAVIRATVFNATERRRYERELLQRSRELQALNERKNQLLGVAAHDLRAPLSVIQGFAEMLEEDIGATLGPEQSSHLAEIKEASRRMLALINDILDVASIESGHLRLSLVQGDIRTTIERAVVMNRIIAARKSIVITLEATAEPLPCAHDPGKLDQVLNNLIGNALKFSPRGSRIDVGVARDGDHIRITIADQGPGIPARDLPSLFQPFAVGSAQSTGGERSTGLGLAIVRRIVEGHRGDIAVANKPGAGAVFTVRLPMT